MAALCAKARGLGQGVLLVMPSDHLIRDQQAFAAAVERAKTLAAGGSLVTFGITPTHPETGFGYIECGEPMAAAEGALPAAFRARRFVEKPPLASVRANTSRPAITSGTRACSPSPRMRSSMRYRGMRQAS